LALRQRLQCGDRHGAGRAAPGNGERRGGLPGQPALRDLAQKEWLLGSRSRCGGRRPAAHRKCAAPGSHRAPTAREISATMTATHRSRRGAAAHRPSPRARPGRPRRAGARAARRVVAPTGSGRRSRTRARARGRPRDAAPSADQSGSRPRFGPRRRPLNSRQAVAHKQGYVVAPRYEGALKETAAGRAAALHKGGEAVGVAGLEGDPARHVDAGEQPGG
jgi:hypothetical protein